MNKAIEFVDTLVTCELAAREAELSGVPVNKAIIRCWSLVKERVSDTTVTKVFDDLVKNIFPYGRLKQLRRVLNEELSS